MKRSNLAIGIISIAAATIIFSTMEVMLKAPAVHGAFHPMQITVDRFALGGLCLIPFAIAALRKRGLRLELAHLGRFALTGLLCVPLSMVCYQLAVTYGHANVVAVLFSANPIFVTILAFLILKEAIHWNNVTALVLSILGIVAIINPFSSETDVSAISVTFTIIASILFSLYSILGKKLTKTYGGIVVTCGSFLFGSGELLLILLLGRLSPVQTVYQALGLSIFCDVPFLSGISSANLPYFLYICLINSAAGYVFHMMALEKAGAHMTNLVFFFKPIVAPVIALFALGEAITANMLVGIAFFLLGSLSGIIPALLRARHAHNEALPSKPDDMPTLK